jgi:hypothetical protein
MRRDANQIPRLANSDLTSEQISKLKGTGKNGMLTKGDVLVALGKIKSVWGSAEKLNTDPLGASGRRASEVSLLYQYTYHIQAHTCIFSQIQARLGSQESLCGALQKSDRC